MKKVLVIAAIAAAGYFVFIKKDDVTNENETDEIGKPIQLSAYSDVNWNKGVGLTVPFLLVDNSPENWNALQGITRVELSDGTVLNVTEVKDSGSGIYIVLSDIPAKYASLINSTSTVYVS